MKKALKSIISMVLVLAVVTGLLPQGLTDLAVAQAEQNVFIPATVPAGFDAVLARAEAERGSAGESSQGGWRYVTLQPENYAVITGYEGTAPQALVMPDLLGGADVVGVLEGALQDLSGVSSVEIPGNVLAMGKHALPAGAIVRAVSGSYAETWARKNGHAYTSTSKIQFTTGVVDFTGIREENFVRISENEVWLRPLEAGRIKKGSVFFLVDPSNAYQISYYKAETLDEEKNGFVVVHCSTPEVDNVIAYYEATNQPLMPDYSTLHLYGTAQLDQSGAREIDGTFSGELGFTANPTLELSSKTKVKAKIGYTVKNEASWKVGFFVTNELVLKQEEGITISASIESSTDLSAGAPNLAGSGETASYVIKKGIKEFVKTRQNEKGKVINVPLGEVVLFSWAGIVNVGASFILNSELTGEISFTFESKKTTTTTYREGQDPKQDVVTHKKTMSGNIEGKLKVGIFINLELYLAAIKILTGGAFVGIEAKASFDLTGMTTLVANGLSEWAAGEEYYYKDDINVNMMDCIKVEVHFVVEGKLVLGASSYITLAEVTRRLVDIPLFDFHIHLLPLVIHQIINPDETEPSEYRYYVSNEVKSNIHFANDCPYDTKTVKFIGSSKMLPYRTYKNVIARSQFRDPELGSVVEERDHRKLISWHTSASQDEKSKVTWPYTITGDTIFYANTVPMHKVHLIDASGRPMALDTEHLGIFEGGNTTDIIFKDRDGYVAEGEYIVLPDETTEHVSIINWIEVPNGSDFIVLGDPMEPYDRYTVGECKTDEEEIWLCGLTDQDIVANFYTGISQTLNAGAQDYETSCVRRGLGFTVPECTGRIPGYAFRYWTDENGEVQLHPGDRIPTNQDTASVLTYYAHWEYDGSYTPDMLDSVAIGTPITPTGTKENAEDMFTITPTEGNGPVTITGFNSNTWDNYAHQWVEIPETINGRTVEAIAQQAFINQKTLRFISLPSTITTIGAGAFMDCTNLHIIDLTKTGVTQIPNSFADGCTSLQCVLFPAGTRITSIGSYAFRGCRGFKRISIDADIGSNAFSGCTRLIDVTLGGGVTKVESGAFSGCTQLAALTIPESVTTLGTNFINGCTALKTLEIPGTIESLSQDMMHIGTSGTVETVTIGYGTKSIGYQTFSADNGYSQMTSITLPGTITSIGTEAFKGSSIETLTIGFHGGNVNITGAFSGCNNLKTVYVQNGKISKNAFKELSALEEVYIGAAVSSIDEGAFSYCPSLTTVYMEEGLTSIGTQAFAYCPSLVSMTIPDSVRSLGSYILWEDTGLKTLSVGMTLNHISGSAESIFYIGPNAELENLIIRGGVTSIPDSAFRNSSYGFRQMETLTLPDTLETVGSHAFARAGIRSLTVNNAAQLLSNAFEGCERLEEIIFNGGDIGDSAFQSSPLLRRIVVRCGTIGQYAFADCPNLTSAELQDGVRTVGYGAFQNCTALTSLSFPDTVTTYGEYLIRGCSSLTELTIGGGVPEFRSYYGSNYTNNNHSFYIGPDTSLRTIKLNEGIQVICSGMFANNGVQTNDHGHTNLAHVSFPTSLHRIDSYAFRDSGLQDVVFYGDVELGQDSFYNLQQLRSVRFCGSGTIGLEAFENCTALANVDLGQVTTIEGLAFKNCSALYSLYIPDSVYSMSASALDGCTGLTYLSIGEVLDTISGTFHFGGGTAIQRLDLREGVEYISGYLFSGISTLQAVNFPQTLRWIGDKAFQGSGLTEVGLRGCVQIGEAAFANCPNLQEVRIEEIDSDNNKTDIFSQCTALRYVTILSGVIPGRAFAGCLNLTNVNIGDAVRRIGSYAFRDCRSLETLSIPDSVTQVYSEIIRGCVNLRELYIGGGLSTISYDDFYVGPGAKLEVIEIGEGVQELGSYAFANLNNTSATLRGFEHLHTIHFPTSLTRVGPRVIDGSAVTQIYLPGTVTIEGNAFSDLQELKRVTVKAGLVQDSAFANCPKLTYVTLKEGVTGIYSGAFMNCTSLTSMYIPDSVTYMAYGLYGTPMPFQGCTGLRQISVGRGVNQWNSTAAPFCIGPDAALRSVEFRTGLTNLRTGTFANRVNNVNYGLPNLETLTLPETTTAIGDENLRYLPGLQHLYLRYGATITETGSVPQNLTLYTDYYEAQVEDFANEHNLQYVVRTEEEMPIFRLIRVIAGNLINPRGLTVSDGTLLVTRGTEGEPATLGEGFAVLSDQPVAFTEPLVLEDPPVGENMVFLGWYTDPEFTAPWTGEIMPANDITLYARVEPLVTVIYATDVASLGTADSRLPAGYKAYASYQLRAGAEMPVPADPAPDGYVFHGWYTDTSFGFAARSPIVPDADTVIYAKLQRLPAGARYKAADGGLQLVKYVLEEDESAAVRLPAAINGVPLVSIAAGAFDDSGVYTLFIPDSVTDIPEGAFRNSGLHAITVSEGNPAYCAKNGILYSKDQTVLLYHPAYLSKSSSSFSIPYEVTRIGAYAFAGDKLLSSVNFSSSNLQEIGAYAFYGCSKIYEVILPNCTTTLEAGAFQGCDKLMTFKAQGLTRIDAGDENTETIPKHPGMSVTGPVGEGALRDYYLITDSSGYQYTLQYNQKTLQIYVGDSYETMYWEAGALLPDTLRDVTLSDGTVVNAWYRDSGKTDLVDLDTDTMPNNYLYLYADFTPLFEVDPQGYTTLTVDGNSYRGYILTAWNGKTNTLTLTKYKNNAIIGLADGFLANAGPLGSITIPDTVISIADGALTCADGSLPEAIIANPGTAAEAWADAHQVTFIPYHYSINFVTYGEPLEAAGAPKGGTVTLPVPTRAGREFAGWYTHESLNSSCAVTLNENDMFVMPGNDVTLYAAWLGEDEVVPFEWTGANGQVTINSYTGGAVRVTIPDTINGWPVTAIAPGAFAGTDITGINTGNVLTVGERAFADCRYLAKAVLPAVTVLEDSAFAGCVALNTCTLPETLTSIGRYAFAGTALSTVSIPDSVTELGDSAFDSCAGLRTVFIGSGVTSITSGHFADCTSLEQVNVDASNENYQSADGVVLTKNGGTLVLYPAGREAQSYSVPAGVTAIGSKAFAGTKALTAINLGSTAAIGDKSFMNCTGLVSLDLSSVTSIGEDAFFGCSGLQEVQLGAGLTRLGSFAFVNCSSLAEITIPAAVTLDPDTVYFGASSVTVIGTEGSSAQEYAELYDLNFTDPNAAALTGLTLTESTLTLQRGETAVLVPQCTPASAQAGANLRWYSTDTDVAIVDADGTVRAIGGGTATIKVRSRSGLEASCVVTVQVGVQAVKPGILAPLTVGQQAHIDVSFTPAHPTDTSVTWACANPAIATVDEDGNVTGVALGQTVITVTAANGVSAEIPVEVFKPVESITITAPEQTTYAVQGANTLQLTAEALPADATYRDFEWGSSSIYITVDDNGLVTARSCGTATITAYSKDPRIPTATYDVTIDYLTITEDMLRGDTSTAYTGESIVPGLTLEYAGYPLVVGTNYTMSYPYNMTEPGIYTVSFEGKGNCTGSFSVQYMVLESGLDIYRTLRLLPGQSGCLPAPAGTEGATLTYASSDETVFTVNANGLITAQGEGTAILTVTAEGIGSGQCCITVGGFSSQLTLPAALRQIEEEAFAGDDRIQCIVLGSQTTTIGAKAFEGMTNLEVVVIPASVTTIAGDAFSGSDPLIVCTKNSAAETFARQKGLRYFSK